MKTIVLVAVAVFGLAVAPAFANSYCTAPDCPAHGGHAMAHSKGGKGHK